ncbi:MAG: DNA recombination protein RmuC [Agriterribacter sp.]
MSLSEILLITCALLLVVNLLIALFKKPVINIDEIKTTLVKTNLDISRIEPLIRTEFSNNRDEIQRNARELRQELSASLKNFSDQLAQTITGLTGNQKALNELLSNAAKDNRAELAGSLKSFEEKFTNNIKDFNELQRQKFNDLFFKQEQIKNDTETKLERIRETVENKLKNLQEDNSKKLEEMRNTVDEKLQNTLEKRFNDSFTLISERLELVHKGLGEMQTLASSVGDIKKVMSNVKSRGILGEYQLANILEDLLTDEQYEKNVKTKAGSGAIVEFAIKMPNNNNLEKALWLPVDSKFPKEDYEALVDAYDDGDPEKIDALKKSFKNAILKNARDIKEKYIDPPNTTEYGIMFLPFESLYAEVLRTPGLFEQIQKDYKITITGPTTLSALLNSLQMGFRTLAIEKRSSEVWDLLGAVKTEFGKFGTVLERTKKKLQEATNTIDQAEVRSRAIERQLRKVQQLPGAGAQKQIDDAINDSGNDIEDRIENMLFNTDDDTNS